jgi:hypothetical protein
MRTAMVMSDDAALREPRIPPGPRWPRFAQNIAYVTNGRKLIGAMAQRYGTAFFMRLPVFGPTVVISDPILAKELYRQPAGDIRGVEQNLGQVLGPGSMFGLQGEEHRRHRKLLLPPFRGDRMRSYEGLIEQETLAEIANWPELVEFPVLPAMMRITLNTILRALFGADGAEFETLRDLMPRMVRTGSRVVLLPWLRRDLGRLSPWGRFLSLRNQFDDVIAGLIARAEADPALGERQDVLSLMLQARDDDGRTMSHSDIADELFTLVVAGYETTATELAWTIERLSRDSKLLIRLADEVDSGGSALLQASIYEVLRTRAVIDGSARIVMAPTIKLGPWVIPRGYTVAVNIGLTNHNPAVYRDPAVFHPDRFLDTDPDLYSWVPFGGGDRRCPGASFANMEMKTVLQTIFRTFQIVPTRAARERQRSRGGVVFAPAKDGRIQVRRKDAPS